MLFGIIKHLFFVIYPTVIYCIFWKFFFKYIWI